MNKKNQKSNIIRFPVEKVKAHSQGLTRHLFGRKEIILSASLVILMVVGALTQFITAKSSGDHQVRGIASLSSSFPIYRNSKLEKKWAGQLSHWPSRKLASVGSQPSMEDQLVFGRLGGQYSVQFENGKIREIHFNENTVDSKSMSPKYIRDRSSFLVDYRALFPVHFESVYKSDIIRKDGHKIERYQLKGEGPTPSGLVEVALDKYDRFISLKVASHQVP